MFRIDFYIYIVGANILLPSNASGRAMVILTVANWHKSILTWILSFHASEMSYHVIRNPVGMCPCELHCLVSISITLQPDFGRVRNQPSKHWKDPDLLGEGVTSCPDYKPEVSRTLSFM